MPSIDDLDDDAKAQAQAWGKKAATHIEQAKTVDSSDNWDRSHDDRQREIRQDREQNPNQTPDPEKPER